MKHREPIQLLHRIVSRDRAAFGQFYDQFAPLVYSLVLRILKTQSDAEEVVQDVFYQVWRDANKFSQKRGKPEAWLVTIARSRAIDRVRSRVRKTRNTFSLEQAEEDQGFEIPTKDTSNESDARMSIQGLIAHLSLEQKKALELAYFKGMTQSEIAKHLNIPLGTVKTRVRDGLEILKKMLREKEVGLK